eukprot:scaffold353_cov185-Amphora_coffeaeformis.AAC.22
MKWWITIFVAVVRNCQTATHDEQQRKIKSQVRGGRGVFPHCQTFRAIISFSDPGTKNMSLTWGCWRGCEHAFRMVYEISLWETIQTAAGNAAVNDQYQTIPHHASPARKMMLGNTVLLISPVQFALRSERGAVHQDLKVPVKSVMLINYGVNDVKSDISFASHLQFGLAATFLLGRDPAEAQ